MIIILVPLTNWVLIGSDKIICFVYSRKHAALLWKITVMGLNAFTRIILSIIEKTSYFIRARHLKVRSDPYSNDNIVSLLIIKDSVKYYNTFTI